MPEKLLYMFAVAQTFVSDLRDRVATDTEGASASEYAILVAFIVVAVAAAVQLFDLGTIFTGLGTKVQGLINGAGAGT